MAINKKVLTGLTPSYNAQLGYEWLVIPAASGNVSLSITNLSLGAINGVFYQDATGGRTLTINGTSIAVDPGANAVTWWAFAYDGTTQLASSNYATSGNVTPAAPTGGTVDDSANTFTFTLTSGYAASEHEYSLNGAAYVACSSNVISVGNVDVAIGALLVRVKAATGRNASATLSNATAFTSVATFTSTNRLALYKNSTMVRSGGSVSSWTDADGDNSKTFANSALNTLPTDATVDGMLMGSGRNLNLNSQLAITPPVTVYLLIKKTAAGTILANTGNTNGYLLYMDASSMLFGPDSAATYQSANVVMPNMADFKVVAITWAGAGTYAKVYVDGTLLATFTGNSTAAVFRLNFLAGYAGNYFTGNIKGLALFNALHDAATVAAQSPLFKTAAES